MAAQIGDRGGARYRPRFASAAQSGRSRPVPLLAESALNLRAVIESAVDGVIVADPQTQQFLLFNKAICEMLGYSAEQMNSLGVKDIHPTEALAGVRGHFEQILKTGVRTTLDHLVKRKDGSVFYAEIATSLMVAEGRTYAVGFFHDITARKRADDLLTASEARFRTIFESVSDGIVLHDPATGAFVDANPRICEMFGYTREEFLQQDIDRLSVNPSPATRALAAQGVTQAASGTPRHVEWYVKAKNGRRFWLEIAMRRVVFGDREFLISTAHDITERKLSAEALAYTDRILHAVTKGTASLLGAEALDQGMSEALRIVGEALDVDRVVVISGQSGEAASATLEGLWKEPGIEVSLAQVGLGGLPAEPSAIVAWRAPLLHGQPVITHAASAPLPIRGLLEHLHNKSTLLVPIFVAGEFWGNIGLDACRAKREWSRNEIDVLATFAGVIGMVVLRNRTQATLQENEERFHAVTENAQDAIMTTDPMGFIQYWNPAAERMFGYTADEARAKGRIVDWLVPPRFRQEASTVGADFAATGRASWTGKTQERSAVRRDGSEFPIELSLSPFVVGNECYNVAIMRDITERKNAEVALLTSEAQLSNALQIARAGHWVYDVAKDQFTFNDNFYSIFRTSAAEAGGYTMSSAAYAARFCHPDDMAVVGKEVAAAIASTEPTYNAELEHRIIYKGGEVGYVAVRIFAVKDETGKTIRTYGVNQDITARKRNEEALRRLNRTLRTLSSANNALVRATGEQQLLENMCRIVVEVGGYAMAWIGQREDGGSLTPIAHAGEGAASYLDGIEIDWADTARGQGPSGMAVRTGLVQINHDFGTNQALAPWRGRASSCGYRASIALALQNGTGAFGALSIYSREVDAFDQAEVDLLNELASDLAFGITALRDRAGREAAVDRLQRGLVATVGALANTTEVRDAYTAGHQHRVSDLAGAIARRMGLSESRIQGLQLAAAIHDVGKIQVPAEILSKPGKLSPLEFELVKQHSQAGYDIVKGIDFPWPIADMILQHQERLDGSGYPQGLKGDEILLESRILSVADVVEAMMSHRPYRATLGLDAALAEIERGKGRLYDPAAVDACIALFREDRFTFTDTKH